MLPSTCVLPLAALLYVLCSALLFILFKIATINNASEGFKVILTYRAYATTQIACQEQKASPVPQQTCAKRQTVGQCREI